MYERVVLVHYHEVGLKGRNRAPFENILKRNLEHAAGDLLGGVRARRISSRLLVPVPSGAVREELLERLRRVPGVSYLADAVVVQREIEHIMRASLFVLREAGESASFKVDARRSATDFAMRSQDMNVEVGRYLVEQTGKKVDLTSPDATVYIQVVQGAAYVYGRRVQGIGGLPTGTAGRVVALMSAGIDSPVAAWRLIKRGAVVIGVHFSGVPHTNDSSIRLVHEIGTALERHGGLARIYSVPFGDIQREVSLAAPPDLRVLLYRRLMVRVAEEVARRERAKALVTGESLGQVASQTLDNVVVVDEAATLPVLRPLIGMDKVEIVNQAEAIGTYEWSIQPQDDCCTLFMPRSPATHAKVAEVRSAEEALDIQGFVRQALEGISVRDYSCPAYHRSRAEPAGEAS